VSLLLSAGCEKSKYGAALNLRYTLLRESPALYANAVRHNLYLRDRNNVTVHCAGAHLHFSPYYIHYAPSRGLQMLVVTYRQDDTWSLLYLAMGQRCAVTGEVLIFILKIESTFMYKIIATDVLSLLDFKLSPCLEYCVCSFGYPPGVKFWLVLKKGSEKSG
jgi:hypothetical protein